MTNKPITASALLTHLDRLHTTPLGAERIRKNLSLTDRDVVLWCKNKLQAPDAKISRAGKNWYISVDRCIITVNARSYTIITAHKSTPQTEAKPI